VSDFNIPYFGEINMATKFKKKPRRGTCRRCGKRNVIIDEKCLCNKCFPIVLRNANRVGRTYLDAESLDRKGWGEDRFTRSGLFDFDAESRRSKSCVRWNTSRTISATKSSISS
jgi:hypothetical protein